jgi:hypothetical protein
VSVPDLKSFFTLNQGRTAHNHFPRIATKQKAQGSHLLDTGRIDAGPRLVTVALLLLPDTVRRSSGDEVVVIAQHRQIPGASQVARKLGLDRGTLAGKA